VVLTFAQKKEIEQHFRYAELERREIETKKNDIILSGSYEISQTGVYGTSVSDSTFDKVQRIERETGRLQAWAEVVRMTVEHYKSTAYEDFLKAFMQREPVQKVKRRCFISSDRTYYAYRDEIITYAAFKAVAMGLMTI